MRVICIDTPKPFNPNRKAVGPIEGDIDLVIEKGFDEDIGHYYCLERFGLQWGYSQEHFIPCSDIDETELVNHKEEVCTNI